MQQGEGRERLQFHLLRISQLPSRIRGVTQRPRVWLWSWRLGLPRAPPPPGQRSVADGHTLGTRSPVHTSDELLQLPHAGPGLKVLHARLPVGTNVDVELGLVSLGVHQARLAGQDEWAQPDGVDLGGQGGRVGAFLPPGGRLCGAPLSLLLTRHPHPCVPAELPARLTWMSLWKVCRARGRHFMGTSMSCTTWCCSYSLRSVSPWVSFRREILGGTIQPKR